MEKVNKEEKKSEENPNKGRVQKKNAGKVWSFTKPPSDPPPGFGLFSKKKLTPIFFVENFIYNGQNKF